MQLEKCTWYAQPGHKYFFFALDSKFPGVGTLELSNPPGWGRKKRANAPSSVNTEDTILNIHKQRTDKLCLVAVANEFVALNDNRKGNFATFRESDLKKSG